MKRAQAAGEAAPGRPPGDRPWSPAPLPDAGLARRRAALRWLGISITLALVVASAVWFLRREPSRALPLPAGERPGTTSPIAIAAVPTPAPTIAETATPLPSRPHPTRLPGGDAGPGRGDSAGPAPIEASPVAVAPPPRPAQSLAEGRSYGGSVTLPGGAKIELGGIVWSETEPRALLNDRIVGVGAYVEGFTVAKIEEERVALERDGMTIYLTVK